MKQYKTIQKGGHMKKAIWTVAAMAVVSLFFFATSESKAAAKDEFFTMYFFADMSRGFATTNVPRLLGIQDTVYWINKYKGGVQGKKLRVEWADHTNDLSVAATIYERWRTRKNFIFLAVCGSQENEAFHDRYAEDEVVVSSCGVSETGIYPAGYAFATIPLYSDQFANFADYITAKWDWKGKGRAPKLAFMTYDIPYGRACLQPLVLEYAKKKRIEIVDTQFIPIIVVDATTPLTRAKKAGADYVYGQLTYVTLVPLLKENEKLGYGLKFGTNNFGVDEPLPLLAGKAAEGTVLGTTPYKLWSEKKEPIIQTLSKIAEEVGRRRQDLADGYFLGVANVFTLYDLLNQTVPKVGWAGINGRLLRRQLESWGKAYDLHGLVKFDYTPEARTPMIARLVEVRNGQWAPVTDWNRMPGILRTDLKGAYKEPSTLPKPKSIY
jgi:ABC-type branched-subunit amino acid transport system substrate-binding protein